MHNKRLWKIQKKKKKLPSVRMVKKMIKNKKNNNKYLFLILKR